MAKQSSCPQCGHTHLQRIRVRGIRKCAHCGSLVDVRRSRKSVKEAAWWRKLLPA
ncbi:MAG: hypothetical protein IGR92_14840 [Leptolyngbyaceae cyanobacterium T60_A2020_046]|nr:hypothetical protein [Leptolyngbyaceae cyanobacterium T60_A2020_046]